MGEGTDELINGRSNRYSFMYMLRSLPGLVGRVKSKVFTPKGLIKRHIKERGVLHLKINQAWGEMLLRLNIGLKLLPLWSGFTFVVVEWISWLIEVIEGWLAFCFLVSFCILHQWTVVYVVTLHFKVDRFSFIWLKFLGTIEKWIQGKKFVLFKFFFSMDCYM